MCKSLKIHYSVDDQPVPYFNDLAHQDISLHFETYHIKLSAQGGIRSGNFAPRIGMIESKGGLGIDYYAFKDKFEFSAEAFDLSRDPDPRYRIWAGYAVVKGLQVILGIDDLAVTDWRKGFFGFEVGF